MINPIFNTVIVSQRGLPVFSQEMIASEYAFWSLWRDRPKAMKTKFISIEDFLSPTTLPYYEQVVRILWEDFWNVIRTFDNEYVLLKWNRNRDAQSIIDSKIWEGRRIKQVLFKSDEYKCMLYEKHIVTWVDLILMLQIETKEKIRKNYKQKKIIKKKYNVKSICLMAYGELINNGNLTSTEQDMNFIQRKFLSKWMELDYIWIILWVNEHSQEDIDEIMN